jgi:tetratricopeptide (TPR) repeat protein
VYSLGVLLYELVTGTTPFDEQSLKKAGFDEMRRIIREDDPPRPSERVSTLKNDLLSTVADRRQIDPRKLGQSLRGEMDWIVMKCLEKDRNRRYETPNNLADDIERYLQDEPVQACPPSASYKFHKFARRNKTLLAAGGAIAAALFTGLALSTWMYLRERAAVEVATANEARATTESARAKAVSDFLLEMIFSPSRGWRIKGSQYTVREMLDDYATGLKDQLDAQPAMEAQLRHAFGCSYIMLGLPERAEPHFKRAIELRRELPGPPTASLAESLSVYGMNLYMQRRYDEAEHPLREALEIYHEQGVRGTMPINVCGTLQLAFAASGRHDDAERAIEQAWAEMQGYDELPPEFAQFPLHDVTVSCAGFAYYFATVGKQDEAAEFLRRATSAQQRLRNPIDKIGAFQFLAQTRLRLGDEAGYRAACEKLANPSPHVDNDEFNLGRLWVCCLGPDAVEDPSDLVIQAKEFAANNSLGAPYVHLALLGAAHYRAGQYKQAAQCLEQSIAQFPSDPPPSHGTVLWPQVFLAMTRWQQGDRDDARTLLSEIEPAIDMWLEAPLTLWQYHVNTEVLRREAETLIKQDKSHDP